LTACAVSTKNTEIIDLNLAWRVHPQVSIRPEPFGALLYHFGTRKLSFLKDRRLLEIVQVLSDYPTARQACEVIGVTETELPQFQRALSTLRDSEMLIEETA
jgi:mycofactocin biosynthesis protein MftB